MVNSLRLKLTGKRFGKLLVLSEADKGSSRHTLWNCLCDCGSSTIKKGSNLTFGVTKSCGCAHWDHGRTHGLSHTPIWNTWHEMLRRCYDLRRKQYCDYGGRGILVCEFLRTSPVNLLAIIGEKPGQSFSLDRKNNNESYTCGSCAECLSKGWVKNVQWATSTQQSRNRRNVHFIKVGDALLPRPEVAEKIGVPYTTFRSRMQRGVIGDALLAPVQKPKKHLHNNALLTISEISNQTGVPKRVLYTRLESGKPLLQ